MTLMDWDPHIFHKYLHSLLEKLPECSPIVVASLKAGMPKIAEQVYDMPGALDTLAGIGMFYQTLGDYRQALQYYRQSVARYGESDHLCYNCGLCHHHLGDNDLALEQIERALQLNPQLESARYWLDEVAGS